jgi:DNA-binding NarL/FixJ family response regulator
VRILIVDDELLDLFIAKAVLQNEFQVECFTTLTDAIAWSMDNEFDAALIDYYLGPDTYATHVITALQNVKQRPIRNAFVLTSYVDSKQVQELMAAGFEGIINKPVSLEVVRSKLGVTQ